MTLLFFLFTVSMFALTRLLLCFSSVFSVAFVTGTTTGAEIGSSEWMREDMGNRLTDNIEWA